MWNWLIVAVEETAFGVQKVGEGVVEGAKAVGRGVTYVLLKSFDDGSNDSPERRSHKAAAATAIGASVVATVVTTAVALAKAAAKR